MSDVTVTISAEGIDRDGLIELIESMLTSEDVIEMFASPYMGDLDYSIHGDGSR